MGILVTASGRIIVDRPLDQARMLADLLPPEVLDRILRFVLDGGRGNVILGVKDRAVAGARIDLILF